MEILAFVIWSAGMVGAGVLIGRLSMSGQIAFYEALIQFRRDRREYRDSIQNGDSHN